jgi:hypothetical protein
MHDLWRNPCLQESVKAAAIFRPVRRCGKKLPAQKMRQWRHRLAEFAAHCGPTSARPACEQ